MSNVLVLISLSESGITTIRSNPELPKKEMEFVMQWKEENVLESFFISTSKKDAVLIFRDIDLVKAKELVEILPYFPYMEIIAYHELDKQFQRSAFHLIKSMMSNQFGTKENPWTLKTPPLSSEFSMYKDNNGGMDILVRTVGKTVLHYDYRCLDHLHRMLRQHGEWMELGIADEQKLAKEGTVEFWGRSATNPVSGWQGLNKGFRGRFGMYIPPLMEKLGLAELTHEPKNNKMRAKSQARNH